MKPRAHQLDGPHSPSAGPSSTPQPRRDRVQGPRAYVQGAEPKGARGGPMSVISPLDYSERFRTALLQSNRTARSKSIPGDCSAFLFSLDGEWLTCTVHHRGGQVRFVRTG
jgi:hypothetical protein